MPLYGRLTILQGNVLIQVTKSKQEEIHAWHLKIYWEFVMLGIASSFRHTSFSSLCLIPGNNSFE